jgi:hypothetical protein
MSNRQRPLGAPQNAAALPELCRTGTLASRICEHGTKGCTVRHPAPNPVIVPALYAGAAMQTAALGMFAAACWWMTGAL